MKKLLLSFFVTAAAFSVGAQSLTLITNPIDTIWGPAYSVVDAHGDIYVQNTSNDTVEFKVKRLPGWETNALTDVNYFCWAQCYLPTVSDSPDPYVLAPGQTHFLSVYAQTDGDGNVVCGDVSYQFYETRNPSDILDITVTFCTGATISVKENVRLDNFKLFPNPAQNNVTVEYNLRNSSNNANVYLTNMLGARVVESSLDVNDNRKQISVANLPSGVYFLSIVSDEKVLKTERLVVSH